MEANVPILTEIPDDTRVLVNEGGYVKQAMAALFGHLPSFDPIMDEGKFLGIVNGIYALANHSSDLPEVNPETDEGKVLGIFGGVYQLMGLPQGVAVADAAGEAPTAAEFKALLDSLRNAGIIATQE